MSADDRRAVAEGLAHYERLLGERTAVPTWKDYLPDSLKARAAAIGDDDPAAALRAAMAAPAAPAVGALTAEQIALLDATVRTAPPVAEVAPTPEELFPAVKPPRKRAKKEAKRGAAAAPAAAGAASTVSARARAALGRVWEMGFGPERSNPFRTRLTRQACASLGVANYHDVVADVVDLALVQKRAAGDYYADDGALRDDIRQIAANASAYHGAESVYAAWASQLTAAYDAAYATAR